MMIPKIRTKYDTIIAIDPDVDGCGLALWRTKVLHTRRMSMPEVVEVLRSCQNIEGLVVVIEAGWRNGGNYHITGNESARKASKIGENVGRCHEIGRQLIEFCKYFRLEYEEKFPLKKVWQTSNGKISHDLLMQLCKGSGIKYNYETKDGEQRDAALIAIDLSGIPIIMSQQK